MSRYPNTPRFRAADAIDNLSPTEAKQLYDLMDYFHSVASHPQGFVPEGSLADVIMRQPPAVRDAVFLLHDAIGTPRDAPFAEKASEEDWLRALGADPKTGKLIVDAIDGLSVMGALRNRMKDDSDRPPAAPTARNYIAQAAEAREPRAHLEKQVTDYLSNSAGNLSLRDTIEVVGDIKAQHLGQDYSPVDNEPREPGSLRDVLGTIIGDYDAAGDLGSS